RAVLVDVLDRDRLHVNDHLIVAGHGIREILVARDATDPVQHGRLHHSSRPKNAAIRRCQATMNRGGRTGEWFHLWFGEGCGAPRRRPRPWTAVPWCPAD